MVDRLKADGILTDPLLRDALLRVPREALLPHAYVRVSGPGADLIDCRLLDGSHPEDQEAWLELIHSDESILLQPDGDPLDALPRGPVTGGHMTSMSTYTPATIEVLQALGLAQGHRYLELGPGPGVSLALAAAVTGPGRAIGVERDRHMAAFAQRNLDRLGLGAAVVEDDALQGHQVGSFRPSEDGGRCFFFTSRCGSRPARRQEKEGFWSASACWTSSATWSWLKSRCGGRSMRIS